jgi:hypothetical protein
MRKSRSSGVMVQLSLQTTNSLPLVADEGQRSGGEQGNRSVRKRPVPSVLFQNIKLLARKTLKGFNNNSPGQRPGLMSDSEYKAPRPSAG